MSPWVSLVRHPIQFPNSNIVVSPSGVCQFMTEKAVSSGLQNSQRSPSQVHNPHTLYLTRGLLFGEKEPFMVTAVSTAAA